MYFVKQLLQKIYRILYVAWGLPLVHTLMFIGIIIAAAKLFGGWGIIGFIIANIVIGIVIVILRWRIFMEGLRMIEMTFFGKTMDKEFDHIPRKKFKFKLWSKQKLFGQEEKNEK